MQEHDTVVLDCQGKGRHRLPASSLRQALSRMSLGAAAVVLTIGLAMVAAVATGLTGASFDLGIPVPKPSTQAQADSTTGRAAALGAGPTAEPAPASDTPEPVASVADEPSDPGPVADAAPVPADEPAPNQGPARAPVSTVRPGDPCSGEGSAGVTAGGKPAVCAQRGDGRTRWRLS